MTYVSNNINFLFQLEIFLYNITLCNPFYDRFRKDILNVNVFMSQHIKKLSPNLLLSFLHILHRFLEHSLEC